MRRIGPLLLAVAFAGCGGGGDRLTIYLPQRLGPQEPHYQRVPLLMPVERKPSARMSPARQAALELTVGPAPQERARGFLDTMPLASRLLSVEVAGETATVRLAGAEPDYLGSAAIVYSLTEDPAIARVRLLLEGRLCCVYDMQSRPWPRPLDRDTFRGWTGEPCALRAENRCRRGG